MQAKFNQTNDNLHHNTIVSTAQRVKGSSMLWFFDSRYLEGLHGAVRDLTNSLIDYL